MTFSEGPALASAIKHYDIGALIGRETTDRLVQCGGSCRFRLANAGLHVAVASARVVSIGAERGAGCLVPDYEVAQSPEDTANGVDTPLQFTLDLIEE